MTIMLREPASVTSTNYKLLPGGKYYTTRRGGAKVKALVVHVTAGLQDLGMSGKDTSAEGTNKWALSSGVESSWHRIVDTDGVISCLPSWYTAWQAKGYNSNTVGVEIANKDARWDNKPKEWVKWTIWYAALAYADYAKKYKVPLRRATKTELDRAIARNLAPVGFIDHSRLSDIRVDPGKTFPWAQFFGYIKAIWAGAKSPNVPPKPDPTPPNPTQPTNKAVPTMLFYQLDQGTTNQKNAVIMSDGVTMRWVSDSTSWTRIKASIKDQIGKEPTPVKVHDLKGVALFWIGPKPQADYPLPSNVKIITEP